MTQRVIQGKWGGLGLPKKAFAAELERVKRDRCNARDWSAKWGPRTPRAMNRVAHNILMSERVYELPDYGRLADVRELIALRIAPWLKVR